MLALARRLRADLAPVDRVHVAFYVLVLALCALRFPALPAPALSLSWYGGALGATLLLARALRGRSEATSAVVRSLYTMTVAPVSFLMLGDVVPYVNPFHGERWLRAIDDAMFFGVNPNEWLDRLAWPPLTEVLQLNYALYYFIPIVLFVCLLASRRHEGVSRGLFLVLLCLYASYVGYFVIPATGPNLNRLGLYPPHFTDPMPGLWVAQDLRQALHDAERIKQDCWPSGHTALSWTCLVLARREHSRLAFWLLLPPVVALIFSTMYLRYHYVIDVVCGFALSWAVLRFGPHLYERARNSCG